MDTNTPRLLIINLICLVMFVNLFPISLVYTEKRKLREKLQRDFRRPEEGGGKPGTLRNVSPLQS